jgi:hypothetical protein
MFLGDVGIGQIADTSEFELTIPNGAIMTVVANEMLSASELLTLRPEDLALSEKVRAWNPLDDTINIGPTGEGAAGRAERAPVDIIT